MANGIRHLCDEKIKDSEFQYFLDNLESFEATEKVDGTNITFGLDDRGDFFINRDKKDGRKFGNIYPNNKFLLGTVFSKYFDVLYKFAQSGAIRMTRDCKIEAEIIEDPITNVVPYDPRQIIILNVDGYIEIYKPTIEIIPGSGIEWTIKVNRPYKIDSNQIRLLFNHGDRSESLVEMKKQLLDIPSQYGSNNPDSWIEGLVFKSDVLVYKLVNKDRFTTMNKFLHELRAKVSAPKPGVNSTGGLYQEMIAEIAKHYGVENVATSQRKRWIRENPDWIEQVAVRDHLFYSQNAVILRGIINKYISELENIRKEYLASYKDKYLDTPYGRCYIDEYTHTRNLASIDNVAIKMKSYLDTVDDLSLKKQIGLNMFRMFV